MPRFLPGFASTPWLAVFLAMFHALIGGTAIVIELLDAWNDMNPTMLVWLALRFVDYPLWLLVDAIAPPNASTTAALVMVAALGTVAWFLVGLVLQSIWQLIAR